MELNQIRDSGNLELYLMGELSEIETSEIDAAIIRFPELKNDLAEIERALEAFARTYARPVAPDVLPMLLAQTNYMNRLENGEVPVVAPSLTKISQVQEYLNWLENKEFDEPLEYDSMAGIIIGSNEEKTTMVVWLKEGAPPEVHTDEIEKFLIVEGTCDITIGETVHSLKAGDFLEIPLFISHSVKVTSSYRCKLILERAAA